MFRFGRNQPEMQLYVREGWRYLHTCLTHSCISGWLRPNRNICYSGGDGLAQMSPEDCIKEELWSPGDGVSEAAALAGLYEGHQVKDELVIGPEVMQSLDWASGVAEQGYVIKIPGSDLSLEVVVVKEEIISPREDSCGLNENGRRQKPAKSDHHLVLRECFVNLDHIFIDKMHKCENCLKIFSSDASLSNHMCLSKDSMAKPRNALRNKKINYICDICEKHFASRITLTNHLVIHSGLRPFICEVCGKQFTHRRNLLSHSVVHEGHKFFCDVCCKGFGLKCTLTRHIRTHTRDFTKNRYVTDWSLRPVMTDYSKLFSCKMCSKVFKYKWYLKRHALLHTEEKRFGCDTCSRRFTQKHHLIRHNRTHTKEKPFLCNTCGKNFAAKHHLTRHVLTHTKERPYSCENCERKFAVKSNLVAHNRTHKKKLT